MLTKEVCVFKQLLAHFYEDTYKRLLEKLRGGFLIHADETEVTLKRLGKGYVWVFGSLLRGIVATVDEHGLKRRYLVKHKRDVDRFFDSFAADTFRSEVATSYRERLLKCRDKLFTFLDHDGIPWNNNSAEHAVKQFA